MQASLQKQILSQRLAKVEVRIPNALASENYPP
jgi:hypothetical protein